VAKNRATRLTGTPQRPKLKGPYSMVEPLSFFSKKNEMGRMYESIIPKVHSEMMALYATEDPMFIKDRRKLMKLMRKRAFKGTLNFGCTFNLY
jgi:hypothetical protein